MLTPALYARLTRQARRYCRRADEAEDLVQTVLLAALKAGRRDLEHPRTKRWIAGALRKRAAFDARSALRRARRESLAVNVAPVAPSARPDPFLAELPPALRQTAQLALAGHTRAEIAYLLGVSDAALRQRLTQIRRRWRQEQRPEITGLPGLSGALPFGLIRRALHPALAQTRAHLGSHDPDGHLFVLGAAHKTGACGNNKTHTPQKEP